MFGFHKELPKWVGRLPRFAYQLKRPEGTSSIFDILREYQKFLIGFYNGSSKYMSKFEVSKTIEMSYM